MSTVRELGESMSPVSFTIENAFFHPLHCCSISFNLNNGIFEGFILKMSGKDKGKSHLTGSLQ